MWEHLKRRHNKNYLFEDPEFPATNSSIYFSQSPPRGIKWMRPLVIIAIDILTTLTMIINNKLARK